MTQKILTGSEATTLLLQVFFLSFIFVGEILPVVQTRPCRTLAVSNCEGGRWVELAVTVDRIVVGDLQIIEFEGELFLVLSLQHS